MATNLNISGNLDVVGQITAGGGGKFFRYIYMISITLLLAVIVTKQICLELV